MLDQAVHLVLPGSRVAAFCEWESFAAGILLARMEDASLEPAPVFCGDLREFDARAFSGVVDILTAGLPCQPYSVAGKQVGNTDHRSFGDGSGPIAQFLRIVAECGPAVVFCENVPAWVRKGWFRPVGEQLCRLGYTIVEPVFVSAADVGASHKRERVFILAHRDCGQRWQFRDALQAQPESREAALRGGGEMGHSPGNGSQAGAQLHGCDDRQGSEQGCMPVVLPGSQRRERERLLQPDGRNEGAEADRAGRTVAEPEGGGFGELREPSGGNGQPDGGGGAMENSNRAEPQRDERIRAISREAKGTGAHGEPSGSGQRMAVTPQPGSPQRRDGSGLRKLPTVERDCRGLFAPGPGAITQWTGIVTDTPCLAPAVKPGFRVLADGVALVVDAARADQLRCVGNGVVAIQGAAAFVELLRRAGLIEGMPK